ncbi:MAG: hypothetical protein Q8K75_08595 [Chlamydiales bacterium]|nr:hypothetical protein [Chlamydiales bacterium]
MRPSTLSLSGEGLADPLSYYLGRFEELRLEDTLPLDGLYEYNHVRRRLISVVLDTDTSKLGNDWLEARKRLVWGMCAVDNPEVNLEGFVGIHDEMCMIAFLSFLKDEGVRSSAWNTDSIDQLTSCCGDYLDDSFPLRSYAFQGNQDEYEDRKSVVKDILTHAMNRLAVLQNGKYMLLPAGWSGEDNNGHFFFIMVSKCNEAAYYSFKLFDTQPCTKRGAERIEAGGWRVRHYTEEKVDALQLSKLISLTFMLRTYSIDAEVGDKVCETAYYPESNSKDWQPLLASGTVNIRGERGCVADSLHALLTYWESCEGIQPHEGKSLFNCFQRYLWEHYKDDFCEDPELYQSISLAMEK